MQKHEPAFFELTSDRLGVSVDRRSDVVFVDDVVHNVEQARDAGWRAVHAPPVVPASFWIAEVEQLLAL